jgi:hypothetical protein
MNGVVSPQHAPTIRKPKIQRKMDGCGSFATGVSGSIVEHKLYVRKYNFMSKRHRKSVNKTDD